MVRRSRNPVLARGRSTTVRRLIVALVLGALLIAGCGGDSKGSASSAPPVSLSGTTNNHGTKTASGSMEVELDDFYFGPTFIKATPGQKITIELSNEGSTDHTFTSTDLGSVDEQLAKGTKKTITITAPASGSALFFCRFHRGSGMQGAVFIG